MPLSSIGESFARLVRLDDHVLGQDRFHAVGPVHVGDDGDPEDTHSDGPGRDDFRCRGHPNGVRSHGRTKKPGFRGRFETRTGHAHVHALFQRDGFQERHGLGNLDQVPVVGPGHVREAISETFVRQPSKGIVRNHVDVIRNDHKVPAFEQGIQSSGRVGHE